MSVIRNYLNQNIPDNIPSTQSATFKQVISANNFPTTEEEIKAAADYDKPFIPVAGNGANEPLVFSFGEFLKLMSSHGAGREAIAAAYKNHFSGRAPAVSEVLDVVNKRGSGNLDSYASLIQNEYYEDDR
jgi:hypothetical protein